MLLRTSKLNLLVKNVFTKRSVNCFVKYLTRFFNYYTERVDKILSMVETYKFVEYEDDIEAILCVFDDAKEQIFLPGLHERCRLQNIDK